LTLPDALDGERPTTYADRLGQLAIMKRSQIDRKTNGQFFTPVQIADLMGELAADGGDHLRILDPGSGSCILSASLLEVLANSEHPPKTLHVDAYETDERLAVAAEKVLQYSGRLLEMRGISLTYHVLCRDFVMSNADVLRGDSLFCLAIENRYDVAILNPPYSKVNKADPAAKVAESIVHGQPNIYSIFLAVAAGLLRDGGTLVCITPRSFASGAYFRRFRDVFFETMEPIAIHTLESRRQAFERDGLLQEWVILKTRRSSEWHTRDHSENVIRLSVSKGAADLQNVRCREVPTRRILDMSTKERFFRLPLDEGDDRALEIVDSWEGSLHQYGLEISTGRVVPFRATDFVVADEGEHTMPLLWMQHVRAMSISWPIGRHKPEHILACADSMNLLIPDRNYVLLRRFSAKEQSRRLTAAPLLEGTLGHQWVGVENHVNYIHAPTGNMSQAIALGLAVILNSLLLDIYFRVINGNTEVSATEIRNLPLPPLAVIEALGGANTNVFLLDEIDSRVESAVRRHKNLLA
jgi:adenine-specific DNA-methyltransferase